MTQHNVHEDVIRGGGITVSAYHQRFLALASTALVAGALGLGSAQAADPTLIRDANPTAMHDLAGNASSIRAMQPEQAVPGIDMKGISSGSLAGPPVQPSEQDLNAGGASRTSEADSSLSTPIGTLNIVRSESPGINSELRSLPPESIAALPPAPSGQVLRSDY
jgi:hypothetical protein